MILAAPLVIPFAEAIGLSVAVLGMAKIGDEVNKYIEKYPEESMKILSTIVPGVGIGEIFMKKGKDEEVEEDIEVEDVDARDLTKKEKAKKMKELAKSGASREKMIKGYEEIILPGKEDEMLDEAEDRYEGGVEEVSKPKFDYKKFFKKRYADGGAIGIEVLFEEKKPRKNFFMGGPALEGQALSIYNSMNAYGFDDQAIANALEEQGLYTPGGSTTDAPTTAQSIGYQGRGDDNPYAGQVVDQTDYSFNKKNYGPGQKLEINPAAVGMSFYDSTTGTSTPNKTVKEDKGIIGRTIDSFMGAAVPGKQLSQFTSPTTGGTLTGPAELGFMAQNIEGIPGNLTREDLRGMYDNYNKFLGRPSNFANARVKGPAGNLINLVPVIGSAARMFGPQGDKSLQSKYTVDGAGFGNTGARDEFGLGTFDAKDGFLGLTGNTTRDYVDRMNERLGELDDFFGSRIEGFDINNLTPDMLNQMSKINGFYTKQIQAYKQRLATENINRNTQDAIKAQAEAKKKEEAAFQAQLNETQRQQRMSDLQRIERAYREDAGGKGGSYATGESGVQSDGSYNDPFDPGGGEKDGGFIDGYNRRKYSEGGLATMFKEKR
jgi:hypothetical protein